MPKVYLLNWVCLGSFQKSCKSLQILENEKHIYQIVVKKTFLRAVCLYFFVSAIRVNSWTQDDSTVTSISILGEKILENAFFVFIFLAVGGRSLDKYYNFNMFDFGFHFIWNIFVSLSSHFEVQLKAHATVAGF